MNNLTFTAYKDENYSSEIGSYDALLEPNTFKFDKVIEYAEDRQRGQQHYDERHKYERLDEHHVPAWHEHRHEQHPNAHRHAAHGAALAYFVDIVITHVSHNPRFCHKVSKKQPQHRQIQEQNGLSPCFFIQTQYNAPFRHGRCPAKAPVGAATSAFSELLHNNFGTKAKYCYFCNNL